jgi:hypothetical protein
VSSQPPRFVPTLTEVVHPATAPAGAAQAASPMAIDRGRVEDELVQRVLQRIDLTMERRLHEALGQLILEHTERIGPHLRDEIESVVRQSVRHAFAQELGNEENAPEV